MLTKKTSTTFDTVEAVVCICVLSGFILSTSSYSVNVSADVFVDGQMATVKCQINNSVLDQGNCPWSNIPIEYLEIALTKNSKTSILCTFTSFLTCTLSIQDSLANSCGCYPEGNNISIVNVTVTANRNTFDGAIIDCSPSCIDTNNNYPLHNTYNGIPIAFVSTTQPPTTTPTTPPTTIGTKATSSSESTTAAPECNSSTANCNESDKCPVWCIVVAVCVPCGVCGITITVVIIIKKKKRGCSCIVESSEGGCNGTKPACSVESSEGGCNGTKPTVQDTKEMEDKTKHHGTENRPKNAQGGSNQTEESAQDTKEMQDKTKHLGTENSAYL